MGGERGKRQALAAAEAQSEGLLPTWSVPPSLESRGQSGAGQSLCAARLEGKWNLARIHLQIHPSGPKSCPPGATSLTPSPRLCLSMAPILEFPSISLNLASRQGSEATKHLGAFRQKSRGLVKFQGRKDFYRMFWKAGLPPCVAGVTFCRSLFILASLLVNISRPQPSASAYSPRCG